MLSGPPSASACTWKHVALALGHSQAAWCRAAERWKHNIGMYSLLCDIASVVSCVVGSTCALPHSAPASLREHCTTAALHYPLLRDGL